MTVFNIYFDIRPRQRLFKIIDQRGQQFCRIIVNMPHIFIIVHTYVDFPVSQF